MVNVFGHEMSTKVAGEILKRFDEFSPFVKTRLVFSRQVTAGCSFNSSTLEVVEVYVGESRCIFKGPTCCDNLKDRDAVKIASLCTIETFILAAIAELEKAIEKSNDSRHVPENLADCLVEV